MCHNLFCCGINGWAKGHGGCLGEKWHLLSQRQCGTLWEGPSSKRCRSNLRRAHFEHSSILLAAFEKNYQNTCQGILRTLVREKLQPVRTLIFAYRLAIGTAMIKLAGPQRANKINGYFTICKQLQDDIWL